MTPETQGATVQELRARITAAHQDIDAHNRADETPNALIPPLTELVRAQEALITLQQQTIADISAFPQRIIPGV